MPTGDVVASARAEAWRRRRLLEAVRASGRIAVALSFATVLLAHTLASPDAHAATAPPPLPPPVLASDAPDPAAATDRPTLAARGIDSPPPAPPADVAAEGPAPTATLEATVDATALPTATPEPSATEAAAPPLATPEAGAGERRSDGSPEPERPGSATVAPSLGPNRATPTPQQPTPRPTRQPDAPFNGIGYNPVYATDEALPDARASHLRRDFKAMADVGIDTVLGWDPTVFDEELLAAAEANQISVLLPFDLKPAYNYAEPETRAQLTEAVLAWVDRFKTHRAVTMWAIGNEVTLVMSPDERRAFASFYAELFEKVRSTDPTRPVILREAEDVFAPYLAEAFRDRGLGTVEGDVTHAPRGFVYGVNFYTDRIGPALGEWVEHTGLDAPLLVSEYAPAGVGRAARAERFARMHEAILAVRPRVIGSAPYTWTTAGPEAVDAYFGLVDADGHPVDGTLAALARLYGVEPPAWASAPAPVEDRDDPAELTRLIDEAVTEGARLGGRDADELRAGVAVQTRAAAFELGVGDEVGSSDGTWAVAQLIGFARELATLRQDDEPLFPGLHEALPLLDGMARWSAVERSADDTARSFMASVLRRDLEVALSRRPS